MKSSAPEWQLTGSVATFKCGPMQALADFDLDGVCFVPVNWKSQRIESTEVLGSCGPDELKSVLQVSELYIRDTDLVANIATAGPHRIAPQIYFRARFDSRLEAIRIELVLSVRTELLDSVPTWTVMSCVMDSSLHHASRLDSRAFEVVPAGDCSFLQSSSPTHLFLFRNLKVGFSYAEMVHPTDFAAATTRDGQQPFCVQSSVFPEHLEKGVIRRARICGWFLPAENDLAVAVELAKQFVDEPLPLTA
jgi:hypothetical protein